MYSSLFGITVIVVEDLGNTNCKIQINGAAFEVAGFTYLGEITGMLG